MAMASTKTLLSFTTIDSSAAGDLELLYFGVSSAPKAQATAFHDHDYWQLEMLTSAGTRLELNDGQADLRNGAVVILPPSCGHRFVYRRGASWLTLRYTVDDRRDRSQVILHENDDPLLAHYRASLSLLAAKPDPNSHSAFAAACRSLLLYLHPPRQDLPQDPLVAGVEQAITAAHGRRIDIAQLARHLGYSRNHLCAAYKQRRGRSLKATIDRATAATASNLLRFDDRSIGHIAEDLGFPDIYAFSRFFLRMTGKRPSTLRHQSKLG